MALTSDEINFLIYRYLRESGPSICTLHALANRKPRTVALSSALLTCSLLLFFSPICCDAGFEHSAYAFGHESFVYKSSLDTSSVPPGALISFVQKGLQYSEIEAHLTDDGSEVVCDEPFSVTKPHVCRERDKRRLYAPYDPIDVDYGGLEVDRATRVVGASVLMLQGGDRQRRMRERMTTCMGWQREATVIAMGGQDGRVRVWEVRDDVGGGAGGEEKGEAGRRKGRQYVLVRVLDETGVCVSEEEEERKAREMRRKGSKRQKLQSPALTAATSSAASASSAPAYHSPNSVLCLDWHPRTNALAIGLYTGDVLLYTPKGELAHRLTHHTAPVSVVRYNRSGDRLLTAGVDQAVCVWTDTGKLVQQWLVHAGPVIDADWSSSSDGVFCTVGTDGCLFLYNLGGGSSKEPKKLGGHVDDVNSVRFDGRGEYFATGGDDHSVRVWSEKTGECLQTIVDHQKAVTAVRWSTPENQHTVSHPSNANHPHPLLLASASLDCTIRLYELTAPSSSSSSSSPSPHPHIRALHTLSRHTHPITALAFQPGAGGLLVSGGHDRVHVWAVEGGVLVRTFRSEGEGGVNEVGWDGSGRRVMVAYADSWNYLIDLK